MEDNGSFIKALFLRLAPLNILALMVSTVPPIVCAILAGNVYGAGGLAVTAVCSPLFFLASFFGFLISGGGQVVASKCIAKDDPDGVSRVFSTCLVLTVLVGALICAGLLLFRGPLLALLSKGADLDVDRYFVCFVAYAFFAMLSYVPLYFGRVVGKPGIGIWMTSIMAAVTIAACLVLVRFMGIEAIALGQAIGIGVAAVAALLMLMRTLAPGRPDPAMIKEIAVQGSPLGMSRLYVLLATLLMNSLLLSVGGSEALAVFGVVATLNRFVSAAVAGTVQTLVPLVGVFHGERDNTSIRQALRISFGWGGALIGVIALLIVLLGGPLGAMFGLSGATRAMFTGALGWYAGFAVLYLFTSLLTGYYNAIGRIALANLIPAMQELAMWVGPAYLLARYGLTFVWAAYPLSGALTLGALAVALLWVRRREPAMSVPLLLNTELEKQGRYMSFSVPNTLESASGASARIGEFCEEMELPMKQGMQISMAIEEIITLIINESGTAGQYDISVRLMLMPGTIIMRLRNAGKHFNPIEYYQKHIVGDFEKSLDIIGMKYVVDSAEVIYYRETFGVNNVVIIL